MKLRLDKYLADMGLGTRTEVKALLKKGCIACNGEVVKRPEFKVDTGHDQVLCQGKAVDYVEMEYILLYKPAGVLTATEDKKQRTVLDLLDASVRKDVFPVGRLDKDTEGLLLITNDGTLAHELLSPKKQVKKCYFARVSGIMTGEDIKSFQEGMFVPEYRFEREENASEKGSIKKRNGESKMSPAAKGRQKTAGCEDKKQDRFSAFFAMPAVLRILSADQEKQQSEVEIEVCEGKFHQVRRMCHAAGKPVIYLKRISMGNLWLDASLKPGEYRRMTAEEIKSLKTS